MPITATNAVSGSHRAPSKPALAPRVLAGPLVGTATAIVQFNNDASTLHPQERELEQQLAPARRADFAAGRLAAARALQALNVHGPVLRDGRRPLFPEDAHGSISHCAGHIGACFASIHPQVLATGVDIERTDRLGRDATHLGSFVWIIGRTRGRCPRRGVRPGRWWRFSRSGWRCLATV
ncbi:hypothetical protein [Streptomyces albus]|uniref:hypothetical protein n=1 Tax=Streptomyces albus TaxID=1888 RepID=UPI001436A9B0